MANGRKPRRRLLTDQIRKWSLDAIGQYAVPCKMPIDVAISRKRNILHEIVKPFMEKRLIFIVIDNVLKYVQMLFITLQGINHYTSQFIQGVDGEGDGTNQIWKRIISIFFNI